jgi:hypothetical protein
MISLLKILKEIADKSYNISSAKEEKDSFNPCVDYEFKTDKNREYYIRFSSRWEGRRKSKDQKYNWKTELTFFPKELSKVGDPSEIGDENFGKILATVKKACEEYIQDYKPEYLFFKGIKSDDKEKEKNLNISKRQRIYNQLMEKNLESLKKFGYDIKIGSPVSYLLKTSEIEDPKEGIHKYPETPTFNDEPFQSKFKLNLQRNR